MLKKHEPEYFQLRLKNMPHEEIIAAAREIIPLCHKYGAKFIMNDLVELALEVNADGLHIGGDDGDVAAARKIMRNKILGVSCYNSLELAQAAETAGADYVSFGAFYPTQTKIPKAKAETETIIEAKSRKLKAKIAAIGGINFKNCQPVEAAGADYLCMISSLWQ